MVGNPSVEGANAPVCDWSLEVVLAIARSVAEHRPDSVVGVAT